MKKILVTGAEGFIGSHITEALVRNGYDVRCFVLYNSFNSIGWLEQLDEKIKSQIEIFTGDIRDPNGVRTALDGCNAVIHLAALIAIPYSYHSPDTYIDTNIKGTLNIVTAARDLGLERVIHTSTSEVYGTALYIPIDESHPLQGQSPYSASKIGADQIAQSFFLSFDTPISTIRPFNTYGPRQSARAVIPTIITQIASGKSNVKLGALNPTRDFNFIDDTVNGFMLALTSQKILGEVVNIGSNFEVSIGQTANIISKLMGRDIAIENDNNRLRPEKSEVERLLADNTKAKELLNWEPKFSGVEGMKLGLQQTINWFVDPNNLKYYKPETYSI